MKKKFLILILVLSLAIVALLYVGVNTYAYDDDTRDSHVDELPVVQDSVRYVHTGLSVGSDVQAFTFEYNGTYSEWVNDVTTFYNTSEYIYFFTGDLIDSNNNIISNIARVGVFKSHDNYTIGYYVWYRDESLNQTIVVDSLVNQPNGTLFLDDYTFHITSIVNENSLSNLSIYDYNSSNVNIGSQVADVITDSFDLGTGILGALVSYFDVLVLSEGELSYLTIFLFAMLGISLVVGMSRWITSLIRRKI